MTRKKLVEKDKKVGIKLSGEERKLILGDSLHIHHEFGTAFEKRRPAL